MTSPVHSFTIKAHNDGDYRYGIDSGFEDTISSDMTANQIIERVKALFQKGLDLLEKDLPGYDLEIIFADINQDNDGGFLSGKINILTLKEETKADFIDHLNFLVETNPFPQRSITVCCVIKPT